MTKIDVITETDTGHGWHFDVQLQVDNMTHHFEVTLNWSDYDLWSRGQVAPERVVRASLQFLLDHEPVEMIMRKFDCAVIRRYFPQVDRELPSYL